MKKVYFLFFSFLFFFSCTATYDPLTGKKVYTLLPPEKEIKIGKMYVPLAIEENDGRYPDKDVQEYVSKIGKKIASVTPRKLDYKFYVVNTGVINAFALPGGFIFVNRGLLLTLEKEDQLAGVLAHELGHVNARHHARFLEKMFGLNILFNIAGIFAYQTRYGDIIMQFGKIGAQLLSLKWSRDQEREADRLGIRFSYEAGYDPRGLLETFKIFERIDKIKAPEWVLTHPLPKNRYKEVSKLIEKLNLNKNLIVDSEQFHKIKRKLEKTKKSYDFYEKAKKELTKKNPDTDKALILLNKAIKLYSDNNAALSMRALIYADRKEFLKASKDAEKAASLDSMYFLPHLVAGYSFFKLKKFKTSINYLEKAKKLIPSFPDTYYYLGRDYEELGYPMKAAKYYKKALETTDGKRGWEDDARRRLKRILGV